MLIRRDEHGSVVNKHLKSLPYGRLQAKSVKKTITARVPCLNGSRTYKEIVRVVSTGINCRTRAI